MINSRRRGNQFAFLLSAFVPVLDARMTTLSTRSCGRRPKSAKARSRGKYGTRRCSECYGDRMLVAISMVDAAPAQGDVHARIQVSPGECNGHLGGHTEFINGRLVN
jgi:hypothetical protein